MNRIYTLVAVVFVVVAPIRAVYCLRYDLAHPEIWDHDRTRDPRLYLPFGAATMVFLFCVFLYALKVGRQEKEMERRRLRREFFGREDGPPG